MAFTVTLSKAATSPVTVNYATSNGTATAGQDYVANTGTITFAAGETSKTINVAINGDATVESDETFTVTLSNPSAGATIKIATATGTITNDDADSTNPGSPGTLYKVTTTGADIVGFDPAKDKLDLGDVSVHSFIVVDTPRAWDSATLDRRHDRPPGVSLGQLTIDNFCPGHQRSPSPGPRVRWRGNTASPRSPTPCTHGRTRSVRSIGLRSTRAPMWWTSAYGSREQISMVDSAEGVIIANAARSGSDPAGRDKSQLSAKNFVFHAAQVREDRLNEQLGIGPVADAQVRTKACPLQVPTIGPPEAATALRPPGRPARPRSSVGTGA